MYVYIVYIYDIWDFSWICPRVNINVDVDLPHGVKMIDNEMIFHIELVVYYIYGPLPLISTYNPIYV